MNLTITEAMLDAVGSAIQAQRPELLGAHTKRYHNTIPPPWNQNEALDSIKLDVLKAEIDYDARGSRADFTVVPQYLGLSFLIDAAMMRTDRGGSQETRFSEPAELRARFEDLDKGRYPFRITDAIFVRLEPPALRQLVSWIISDAISASLDGLSIEETYRLTPKASLQVDRPTFKQGAISLTARLEVER